MTTCIVCSERYVGQALTVLLAGMCTATHGARLTKFDAPYDVQEKPPPVSQCFKVTFVGQLKAALLKKIVKINAIIELMLK